MKMEKTLKKGLFVAASAVLMGMTLFAGETKTYPKDGKGDQVLGYKNLANSDFHLQLLRIHVQEELHLYLHKLYSLQSLLKSHKN